MAEIDPFSAFPQPEAQIPPSLIERFLLGITRFGLTFINVPKPVQVGQAPYGLLKENILGDNSSMLIPCSGQA